MRTTEMRSVPYWCMTLPAPNLTSPLKKSGGVSRFAIFCHICVVIVSRPAAVCNILQSFAICCKLVQALATFCKLLHVFAGGFWNVSSFCKLLQYFAIFCKLLHFFAIFYMFQAFAHFSNIFKLLHMFTSFC